MNTWTDLKKLFDQFEKDVWNIIPPNGHLYSSHLSIEGIYEENCEKWYIGFKNEFFPFSVKGDTIEDAIQLAYEKLYSFYVQVKNSKMTAYYVVGKQKNIIPFSIEDCRKWRHHEIDYIPFATKEEAEPSLL